MLASEHRELAKDALVQAMRLLWSAEYHLRQAQVCTITLHDAIETVDTASAQALRDARRES